MVRDINAEDLFVIEGEDKSINHDFVRSYGLFNLSRELQSEVLAIYASHAEKCGDKDNFKMQVFQALTKSIQDFPFSVYQHFTSGQAYEFNMDWLKEYAK